METDNSISKEDIILSVKRALYKKSLFEFFKAAAPILEPSVKWDFVWFYEYVCNLLQEEVERIIAKKPRKNHFIFNLPFRTGKSTLISQVLPIWCWIVQPSLKIMSISANQDLANRHAEQSLILLQSTWFKSLYGDQFELTSDAVSDYANNKSGRRMSFGMNAKDITGAGANIRIIDDPQTPDDLTPIGIKNTINKFKDKIYSRYTDPEVDVILLVQQRLHQQDLSGHLLSENHDQEYRHICIPVIVNDSINPPELINKYENGYLWSTRFHERHLKQLKKNLGSRAYAGQLLMKPQDDEGGLIKTDWFEVISMSSLLATVNNDPSKLIPMFILDTALTENKKNDPTALICFYLINNRAFIFDVQQAYLNPSQLNNWVMTMINKNGYRAGSMVAVESAAAGHSLLSFLRNNSIRVIDLGKPSKDKTWRASQCIPEWEGGRVVFVNGNYVDGFKEEIGGFPDTAPHDDRVDCMIHLTEKYLRRSNKLNYAST